MAGSNITLGSFSQENNSVVNDDINKKLFEMLTKLNDTLALQQAQLRLLYQRSMDKGQDDKPYRLIDEIPPHY